jgi:uncharacterized repeat protein (TIGR02543 family)
MLDFFKKIFKRKKPGKQLAQVKHDTRQQWRKQITKAKAKRRFLRKEWWDRFPRNRRIIIIAASVGVGFIIWFGIQSYYSSFPMFKLGITTDPEEGGKVSASCGGISSPLNANYRDGSQVILAATPSAGYEFYSWEGDATGSNPVISIIVDGNKELTANFKPIQYALTTLSQPTQGGSISHDSGYYDPGSLVQLTAIPAPGYQFIGWSGDVSGLSPETSLTMDSDKNVTANFSILRYALEISVNPTEGGTISGSGGTYKPGGTLTIQATPAPGYQFVGWSGDISGLSPEISLTMDSDKNVTANFDTISQRIVYTMPAGEISGSIITFYNTLERDEQVEGFVELTGEYKARDRTFRWNFEIMNPEGRAEDKFRGHWVNDNYHDFGFTVVYSGEYKIRIDHNSRYDLYLVIEIVPKGWESSKL